MRTANCPPMSTHLISKHCPQALAGPATENWLLSDSAPTLQKGYEFLFRTPYPHDPCACTSRDQHHAYEQAASGMYYV